MATDIIARGMITEYKSGTNIDFKENEDGSVTISASGNVSSEDIVARGAIDNHKLDKNNPHNVTAEQVGLGNVNNTADLDKPISTAVQTALDDKANAKHTHKKSDITDFPNSLPANGGNADTVNNHTVEADVPVDAVFTDTTYDAATQTEDGLMSAADKSKLDGIEEGANKTVVDTALSGTSTNPVQNKVINSALSGKAAISHTHDNRYYTETEIDAKLDEKAGKDTMTGATSSADGTAGLVPAPASGEQGAYLRGDGTWAVPTNTDTKVTNTLNTTAKAYVTGTTSSSTNTGTQVFDTGVYLDTTAGMLTATTFKGALSGNASTSTKLASSSCTTISIATSDWSTNSDGGYICTKTLDNAMPYENFNFDVVLSTDQAAAKLQIEAWNCVIADGNITQTTSNGSTTAFTFYAFTTKPSVALTIAVQGVS